jgi:non-homologous end joining protein Ku
MAQRAIWKGSIHLGDVEVPVKLYSGVQDGGIHSRLLHDRDGAPVFATVPAAER